MRNPISTEKLYRHPAWALVAAFGTYFCMYGYRKPFTAATYSGSSFWGMDYKVLLVIAQTMGYVLAKWIGIKIISEIKPYQRILLLSLLIWFAECMLLLFALIPPPWNIVCIFLNGLPLGVVFGLILGFLEGRRNTEVLIAGLCASFIVSDGVSKSVGQLLLNVGIAEKWMPFMAGIVFTLPIIIFIFMLSRVPPPTTADRLSRSIRIPMNGKSRYDFFLKYALGLLGITLAYLLVTLMRSIRADFAPELWKDLGYPKTPAVFTQSEIWVSAGVVLMSALAVLFRNHQRAFQFALFSSVIGFVIILISVKIHNDGANSFLFMVLLGLGVYLPYVAIHTTIFERLIAITRERANIGFLMYIVDAVGYTGYIILILLKYFAPSNESILYLFLRVCTWLGVTGLLVIFFCIWYFKLKFKDNERRIAQLSGGTGGYI